MGAFLGAAGRLCTRGGGRIDRAFCRLDLPHISKLFRLGSILAVVAVPFSLVAVLDALGRQRFKAATGAIVLLAAIAAGGIPLYWKKIYWSLPPIHDITTNTENPPLFSGRAQVVYNDRTARLQLEWEIDALDRAGGRIEAVSTTFWFHYKNDVAIRNVPLAGATCIDLRSVSRVREAGDMGANAGLVRRFVDAMRNLG